MIVGSPVDVSAPAGTDACEFHVSIRLLTSAATILPRPLEERNRVKKFSFGSPP